MLLFGCRVGRGIHFLCRRVGTGSGLHGHFLEDDAPPVEPRQLTSSFPDLKGFCVFANDKMTGIPSEERVEQLSWSSVV